MKRDDAHREELTILETGTRDGKREGTLFALADVHHSMRLCQVSAYLKWRLAVTFRLALPVLLWLVLPRELRLLVAPSSENRGARPHPRCRSLLSHDTRNPLR